MLVYSCQPIVASVRFKVPQVVVRSQTAVVSDMKVVHKIRSERF